MTPTVGRIVHYVLTREGREPEHRPAIIVHVWDKHAGCVNLQVFTDFTNDGLSPGVGDGRLWATSVKPDEEGKVPLTWHWPEREE